MDKEISQDKTDKIIFSDVKNAAAFLQRRLISQISPERMALKQCVLLS